MSDQIRVADLIMAWKSEGAEKVRAEFAAVRRVADESAKSVAAVDRSIAGLATRAAAIIGIGQAFRTSFRAAADFQAGMLGVAKTTGLAGEKLEALKNDISKMARTMSGVKTSELLDTAQLAGQTGIRDPNAIVAFTRTVAQMKLVAQLSSEQAAGGLSEIANVWHIAPEDYSRIGSVINELSNTSRATSGDILDLTRRMSGAAQAIGLTAGETMALSAALREVGVRWEVGGTAMSNIFLKMVDPKKFAAFGKVMGIGPDQFQEMVAKKPLMAIKELLESLSKMDKFQVAEALDEIGIDGARGTGVILQLRNALGKLDQHLDTQASAWRENVSLIKEYNVQAQGAHAQTQRLANAFGDLARSWGDSFVNVIGTGAGGSAQFVDRMVEASDRSNKAFQLAVDAPGRDKALKGLMDKLFMESDPENKVKLIDEMIAIRRKQAESLTLGMQNLKDRAWFPGMVDDTEGKKNLAHNAAELRWLAKVRADNLPRSDAAKAERDRVRKEQEAKEIADAEREARRPRPLARLGARLGGMVDAMTPGKWFAEFTDEKKGGWKENAGKQMAEGFLEALEFKGKQTTSWLDRMFGVSPALDKFKGFQQLEGSLAERVASQFLAQNEREKEITSKISSPADYYLEALSVTNRKNDFKTMEELSREILKEHRENTKAVKDARDILKRQGLGVQDAG